MKKSGWKAKRWTKEDDDFLRNNYLKIDYHQIGNILGRAYQSVNQRRLKLGLSKKISGGNIKKPTCNFDIKKEECIYLAGLFDGEGSVSIKNKSGKLACRWAIGMKEKKLMESFRKIWNCGINYQNNKELTFWAVNTRENLKILLPQIIPYMRIKNKKSENLLHIIKNYKRGEILQE